ncbi:MAG: hypothetical protein ACRDQD_08230 [Nocardioidaceae bacterium]
MSAPAERDIVIPLGPGTEHHPELRFTLRSLAANMPHRTVWIVGATPPRWVTGVEHLAVSQFRSKYENSTANVLTALKHRDVSDDVVLANDDMYVMAPQPDGMPVYHRGRLTQVEAYYRSLGAYAYGVGLTQTRQILEAWGYDRRELVSYDIHVPMPMPKDQAREVILRGRKERFIKALHKRTLIGTACELGGTRLRDPKVVKRSSFDESVAFLSSMRPYQVENGQLGALLRARFPEPCRYERG